MEALESLKTGLWIVAIATLIVTICLGAILHYHWRHYSENPRVARISLMIYSIISFGLLVWMFSSIPV